MPRHYVTQHRLISMNFFKSYYREAPSCNAFSIVFAPLYTHKMNRVYLKPAHVDSLTIILRWKKDLLRFQCKLFSIPNVLFPRQCFCVYMHFENGQFHFKKMWNIRFFPCLFFVAFPSHYICFFSLCRLLFLINPISGTTQKGK